MVHAVRAQFVYVSEWLGGNLIAVDVDAHTRQVRGVVCSRCLSLACLSHTRTHHRPQTLLSGLDHPEGVAVNPLNGHVVVIESGGLGRLVRRVLCGRCVMITLV
jgi:hypothetical protein